MTRELFSNAANGNSNPPQAPTSFFESVQPASPPLHPRHCRRTEGCPGPVWRTPFSGAVSSPEMVVAVLIFATVGLAFNAVTVFGKIAGTA